MPTAHSCLPPTYIQCTGSPHSSETALILLLLSYTERTRSRERLTHLHNEVEIRSPKLPPEAQNIVFNLKSKRQTLPADGCINETWLRSSSSLFKQAGCLIREAWASDSPARNPGALRNQTGTTTKHSITLNSLVPGCSSTYLNEIISFENNFDSSIVILVNFMLAWGLCPYVILRKALTSEKRFLWCPVCALKVISMRRAGEV